MSDSANTVLKKIPPPMRLGGGPDRLDSWKDIANYLKREVRTVQNWEKKEGLPIHRHFHTHSGTVFAFRSEIEEWGAKQAAKQPGTGPATFQPHEPEQAQTGLGERKVRIEADLFHEESLEEDEKIFCEEVVDKTIASLNRLDRAKVDILVRKTGYASSDVDELECDYKLYWDVVTEEGGTLICANLRRNRTRSIVWSRRFQVGCTGGSEAPILIAEQIVQCLWLKVVSVSRSLLSSIRTEKSTSREAYLKGRYFWNRRNEGSMRKAIDWFRIAIQEDPAFALPYSGLADSLTLLSFYEIVSPAEAMPEARTAALKAIELDSNLAEAHASLADIHLHFDRDWESADQEYRRAIQCNPSYALGYHWYANLLAAKGQHEAAQIAIMHALDIDPVSLITQVWAGVTSHLAHRYDDAIRHYQSALELDPNFSWAHMYMAQALEQKGNYSEALQEFETTIKLSGGSNCVTAMKAHALALAGDKVSARRILQELRGMPKLKCMPSYDIAATYAALGECSRSVGWLKRACDERNMKLFKLRQDPRFDQLRNRSEFREVLENVGLAQFSSAKLA